MRAREMHLKPEKAALITNVCAALHNICIYYGGGDDIGAIPAHEEENDEEGVHNANAQVEENEQATRLRGEAIRTNICQNMQ